MKNFCLKCENLVNNAIAKHFGAGRGKKRLDIDHYQDIPDKEAMAADEAVVASTRASPAVVAEEASPVYQRPCLVLVGCLVRML